MITYSPVIVGRMALSHIGVSANLENLSERTPETAQINTWIDTSRIETLEAYNWNFARINGALAAHSEAPPEGQWAYRYQYPFQCLKMRKLWHPSIDPRRTNAIPYEVELSPNRSKSIVTNLPEARGQWTTDVEELVLWTSSAIEAFSRMLASHIAAALVTQKNVATDQLSLFSIVIARAAAMDANEGVETEPRDAPWIEARGGMRPQEDWY